MLKARGTELQQAVTELSLELRAYYGLPLERSTPFAAPDEKPSVGGPAQAVGVAQAYFNTRKASIYAGSNEIQRNIMAKLVLGL